MAGLSAPQTAREDTARVTWAVAFVLLLAIGGSIACFIILDRPHLPAARRPAAWLSAPQSGERAASHSIWDDR